MASKLKSLRCCAGLQILLLAQLAMGQQFKISNNVAASKVNMPSISNIEADAFISRAFQAMEQKFLKQGGLEGSKKDKSQNLTEMALIAEEASKYIVHSFGLNREQVIHGLPLVDIRNTPLGKKCPINVELPCQPRRYRAHSGFCNNVQNPHWGTANTRLLRFLPPDYGEGVSIPRHSVSGEGLPSASTVSSGIKDSLHQVSNHSHLMPIVAVWGEFVANDIFHTPRMTGPKGERLQCCSISFNEFHEECFPIGVTDNNFKHEKKCQEYVRSATAPRIGCTLGPREQLNKATSYLDGSVVYGNSYEEAKFLRTGSKGHLRSFVTSSGKHLLPLAEESRDCKNPNSQCFLAGDPRVNDYGELTALHTLFLLEHNRLASELANLNPHWGDETIYQEARRIVAAQIQFITYNEFLPVLLGQNLMDFYKMKTQSAGYSVGYDLDFNAAISNGVAITALQFIASSLPNAFNFYNENKSKVHMSDGINHVLNGLLQHLSDEKNNADEPTNDIAAQIIQQGRDHGIPSYTKWREFCNLTKVDNFLDLAEVMSIKSMSALNKMYNDVDDIDLFAGGLSENPLEGALVGPTFACLLGLQFHYLKHGDRYWFENDLPPSAFTLDQLTDIRRTSLARILCDNAEIHAIQPQVFLEDDAYLNHKINCKGNALERMTLSPWHVASPKFILPPTLLSEAFSVAKQDASKVLAQELSLFQNKKTAHPHSPTGTAFGFNRPTIQATEIANTSLLLQFASASFVSSFLQGQLADPEIGHSGPAPRDLKELLSLLPTVDISDEIIIPRVFKCDEQTLPCDHTSKFRTATGWCNNLKRPELGKSLRAFTRLIPSVYDDGLSIPRSVSVLGGPLPSARLVSTSIHDDVSFPHTRYTLMFMQFAQLLDHDLTHTPVHTGFQNSILECKECDSQVTLHPECYPIPVPMDDPYYPNINSTTGKPVCIQVTRSLPGQLTLGPREQLNQVTAFIDASFIYGSDSCKMDLLRSNGGFLNVTRHPARGKSLMPQITTHPECRSQSGKCFNAGDARSSEQPGLAAIHTVFMREHNRIVSELSKLNRHWNADTLYQHARRILSAVTQNIVYSEFLPRLLGMEGIQKFSLALQGSGYFEGYDATCDATIVNEFAAAAFRFGHSLLKPNLGRMDHLFGHSGPSVRLRDTFFNPDILYEPGMVDELLRGLATTPMENLDNHITEEVTNHLFEDKRIPFSGMDLAAINVQRAREHGITGYNDYRELCNLTRASSFEDLRSEIPENLIRTFKRIYKHVDDIDLFPGGLAERALLGGLVGPTFACIIGRQFHLLKKCDRFWYENSDPLVRFTETQLQEIRRATLSKIICDNCDGVTSIQKSLMDLVHPFMNPRVKCKSLPSIDLTLWKEQKSCTKDGQEIELGATRKISPCVMCTCTSEGPLCQSLKIGNCFQLARTFKPEAVLEDNVCKVQCAFIFRALPKVTLNTNELLGFSSGKN
ncbi:uncharacterized protein LOC132194111 [Neocloeon triangulifer]|uniref:uncharacterized protein LOC132194111 n=1 Tax=Neocloeon triangulifer TaxID=2078957 RepID=UPI00286F7B10|nr:uncharacterized protein LOC132194111 [Neocloeon triangulifer]